MKSIYSELLDRVSRGAKFKINLVEKTLKIDGKEIELKGNLINEESDLWFVRENPWHILEELYYEYKRSVPSAHQNGNKPYFKSDSVEDLSDDEMILNNNRNYSQAMLEGYVLLAGLNGMLTWQNDKHWFWQSKVYPECVCLREWI